MTPEDLDKKLQEIRNFRKKNPELIAKYRKKLEQRFEEKPISDAKFKFEVEHPFPIDREWLKKKGLTNKEVEALVNANDRHIHTIYHYMVN